MSDQKKGLVITTIAALAITPDSLLVRLISADTQTVVFWRSLLSGLVLLLFLILQNGRGQFSQWRAMNLYHLLYALGLMGSAVFFVFSIRYTSVANAVFILASMPVFACIFSWIWFAERIGLRMLITMILVLFGIAMIAFGAGGQAQTSLLGDVFALLTAISFAIAITVARRVKDIDMVPVIPWAFLAVAVLFWPFSEPFSLTGWDPLLVFVHGGVLIPIAMILFTIGPRYITATEVSLLILLETVLAPIIVWAILGEYPGKWTLIGGAVVLFTLLISNLVVLLRRQI